MQTTFNIASLAKLSKSELYALLAEYRAKLGRADKAAAPSLRSQIAAIRGALTYQNGPR